VTTVDSRETEEVSPRGVSTHGREAGNKDEASARTRDEAATPLKGYASTTDPDDDIEDRAAAATETAPANSLTTGIEAPPDVLMLAYDPTDLFRKKNYRVLVSVATQSK